MFDNLITDRTINDYLRFIELRDKGIKNMTASELEEWQTDLKGTYNISDINRVSEVLNYLRDRLVAAGYLTGKEFSMRTDWEETEIPIAEDLTNYLKAVETVRNAMSYKRTTPPTPNNIGSLDYQGANNIEIIMLDIEELINKMLLARHYVGELYSGEI